MSGDDERSRLKMVIVMRADLDMPVGKMIAQGAHAAANIVVAHRDDPRVREWLGDLYTKVVVKVEGEEKLKALVVKARAAGLLATEVVGAGFTVFAGAPTLTCAAIGPAREEQLKLITGRLRLF